MAVLVFLLLLCQPCIWVLWGNQVGLERFKERVKHEGRHNMMMMIVTLVVTMMMMIVTLVVTAS